MHSESNVPGSDTENKDNCAAGGITKNMTVSTRTHRHPGSSTLKTMSDDMNVCDVEVKQETHLRHIPNFRSSLQTTKRQASNDESGIAVGDLLGSRMWESPVSYDQDGRMIMEASH